MCSKQHLDQDSILNRPQFSIQERQLEGSLQLIEVCHFISVSESKWTNMIKMVSFISSGNTDALFRYIFTYPAPFCVQDSSWKEL